MMQCFTSFQRIILFFSLIVIVSSFRLSQVASNENDNSESADDERRAYALQKLRHFLLTSNAEERAAKREEGNLFKRKLIREYLESANDPDPNRLVEMKKRFTYCSVQDIMHESLCRRRTLHH